MSSITTSELKNGVKLIFDSAPWVLVNNEFIKPGKGQAFHRLKVMNLLTKNTIEKTVKSGEKLETADVSDVDMQYLYSDANGFVFMNKSDFEQLSVPAKVVGEQVDFLLENMDVIVTLWNNEAIDVRLPNTIITEIVYTEPAIQGDTQSRVLKPAKIPTGAEVKVPIFCKIGDRIKVNTQTREYAGRVEK